MTPRLVTLYIKNIKSECRLVNYHEDQINLSIGNNNFMYIHTHAHTHLSLAPASQHHLERRPVHRNVATWQTSEVVGRAPKTCNSYPDAIFK